MNPFYYIRTWFNYAAQVFVNIALDIYIEEWFPDWFGDYFNYLSDFCAAVAGYLYNLETWYSSVQSSIGQILSWSTIWSYILSYVPNLIQIRDWFYYWTTYVTNTVSSWWSSTQVTVLGWITAAEDILQYQIDSLASTVTGLQSDIDELLGQLPDVSALLDWFSDWSGQVWGVIDTWWTSAMVEVQALIDSAFTARDNLWAGWTDWRDSVAEFFSDPVEYIWSRFTNWFLGPEV